MRNVYLKAEKIFDLVAVDSAQALDWSGVNIVNSSNIGTVVGYSNFIVESSAFINSAGLVLSGSFGTIGFSGCLFDASALGIIIRVLDTCVITRRFRITYSAFVVLAGETGLHFSALAAANPESYILDTVNFSGGGTYVDGVTYSDNKSRWINCVGVVNSVSVMYMFMTDNATPTPIASTSGKYVVLGITQVGPNKQRFEHDQPNNAAKYISTVKRSFKAQCSFTVLSNVNNVIGFYICVVKSGQAINPIVDRIAESEVYVTASGSRPDASFVQAIVELEENDRVYLAVENITATNAVTITFLNLVIEQTVGLPFSCLFTVER